MSLPPKDALRRHAFELGFDAVGFAEPDPGEGARADLAAYLAEGRHSGMGWMQRRADERADPRLYFPSARSAILVGLNYAPERQPDAAEQQGGISVYARGQDYHEVMKPKLEALAREVSARYGAQARPFVDTAPVMEKPLAALAGLGWQGKHTNLVSRRFGSWLFLGGVLTDLDLAPDTPQRDRCGRCTRCLDACPTGAITPYRIDPRLCVSYLTIEHKGEVQAELAGRFGQRLYGCDACLAACPWNKFASPTTNTAFRPRSAPPSFEEWDRMDEAAFRARFAGTPVRRTGLARMKRNAAIARQNAGEARHG
jgi:epoxyqueuosine reductase